MKVGKEGPLAHIGSLLGVCCLYLPIGINTPFRNDRDKRAIIAAGAGVGVSAGFGAPIGGVLFAYEISRANSFWTFNLAWKTFLATSVANFTLTFMGAFSKGNFDNVTNQSLVKFGDLSSRKYNMADMVIFVIIGILGGVIGALFIEINMAMARLRKRFIKTKPVKVVEALAFALVGATMVFLLPMAFSCIPVTEATREIGIQYTCPEQHIN
jgi:chloride channel 7